MKRMLVVLIACLLLVGCQVNENNSNGKVDVVVSTTMLADLVKQIGQEHVEVTMLFGPGIDPHLAQPTGNDTQVVYDADLVVFSALNLEAQFHQIVDAFSDKTLLVGEELEESDLLVSDGEYDPHYWFSVPLWIKAAKLVAEELMVTDSEHKSDYESNLNAYVADLMELHEWIEGRINEIESDQRILVTAHDAFNYFANEYGMSVYSVGGMSTDSEVTASSVNEIANLMIEHEIKAIFVESTVPLTSVEAVLAEVKRRGFEVSIGPELFSDALGTQKYAQYVEAIKYNVNSIVESLK